MSSGLFPTTRQGFLFCLLMVAHASAFCPSRSRRGHETRRRTLLHDVDVPPLDRETERALRSALGKVERLRNETIGVDGDSTLARFFRQCDRNCRPSPSSIVGAGTGLVARQTIQPGAIISLYPIHCLGLDLGDSHSPLIYSQQDSQYLEQEDALDMSQDYVLNLIGSRAVPLLPTYVDASKIFLNVFPNKEQHPSWIAHLINDGATVTTNTESGILEYYRQSATVRNCVLVPLGPCPLMAAVATRTINKGNEILTTYGCMYWLEKLLNEDEECTEITDAIQQEAQAVAKALFQGVKGIAATHLAISVALQEAFDSMQEQ